MIIAERPEIFVSESCSHPKAFTNGIKEINFLL